MEDAGITPEEDISFPDEEPGGTGESGTQTPKQEPAESGERLSIFEDFLENLDLDQGEDPTEEEDDKQK